MFSKAKKSPFDLPNIFACYLIKLITPINLFKIDDVGTLVNNYDHYSLRLLKDRFNV